MRTPPRNGRRAFRPSVAGIALEERLVLSAASAWITPLGLPTGRAGPASPSGWTARDLSSAYIGHFGQAQSALRQYVGDQVSNLYSARNLGAYGRPTQGAVDDFNGNVGGAINAVTLGLSAQSSLLPGSGDRLVPAFQQSMQGGANGGLAGGIARQVGSGWDAPSRRALQNSINRQISATLWHNASQVWRHIRSPRFGLGLIDPTTGQSTSLAQYMQNQAALQINNTLGALANNVGPNAGSAVFDATGAFDPGGVNAFQQRYATALNSAAYQVDGILSAIPNSSSIRAGLQSSFFGSGGAARLAPAATSFYGALTGAFPSGSSTTPFTMNDFNTGYQSGFTSAYQSFNNQVGPFLGQPMRGGSGPQLPDGYFQPGATFPSVFGPEFTGAGFNSGFNNGFATTGTGFPGFGTAPSGFNPAFGTGYDGYITAANGLAGITGPGFATIGGAYGGLAPV